MSECDEDKSRDIRIKKMEEFIKAMKENGEKYFPNAPSRWEEEEQYD